MATIEQSEIYRLTGNKKAIDITTVIESENDYPLAKYVCLQQLTPLQYININILNFLIF